MKRALIVLLAIGVSAASPIVRAAECDGGVECLVPECADGGHVAWGADAARCVSPANPQQNMVPPEEEDPGTCHCLWTSPAPVGLLVLGFPLLAAGLGRRFGRRARD